jgi:hypothetical protein
MTNDGRQFERCLMMAGIERNRLIAIVTVMF